MIHRVHIKRHERGVLYRHDEPQRLLGPGRHVFAGWGVRVDKHSTRDPWLRTPDLDILVREGLLGEEATVLDLADGERGLVWVDDRFDAIVGPGLHALWTAHRRVRIERVRVDRLRFEHPALDEILAWELARDHLLVADIHEGFEGVLYDNGRLRDEGPEAQGVLGPGRHVFWMGTGRTVQVVRADVREQQLDVSGQELMTADRVTLRLNALVTFRVVDARAALTVSGDHKASLYREAQLALRASVSRRTLDELLADKESLSAELVAALRAAVRPLGLSVKAFGLRDVILPGAMKELLNRVTEARTAAEAAVITRREETAAMRSQANTAKLLAHNPTLMRLRELETLERVAERGDLTVVLGGEGLADRLVNML